MPTNRSNLPRLLIAALAGDSGKSLLSVGLVRALRARGLAVAPFKKGPDYIDAAWLGAAAGTPGRNLDSFMMGEAAILGSLERAAGSCDLAVIEGNRGVFDGLDAVGTHSSSELAKLVAAPVVLVLDVTKTSRTAAALVLGCRAMDPALPLAGVLLNRCGTARQEALVRQAVERESGLPVLGAVPRLERQLLPARHLGLVTAAECPEAEEVLELLGELIEEHADVSGLLAVARKAGSLPPAAEPVRAAPTAGASKGPHPASGSPPPATGGARARVGVLRDRAFSFYYPENFEALQEAGAELVFFSPLADEAVPPFDALYAGGGFPEAHAAGLSSNRGLREELRRRIAGGLPVWAECGGLMYLCGSIEAGGVEHPMVGALPGKVELSSRPQGHGYVEGSIDRPNPFLDEGTPLAGHEFHYSRLKPRTGELPTAMAVRRGVGLGHGRDGLVAGTVLASYTHLHALGTPQWAPALVRAARGARP